MSRCERDLNVVTVEDVGFGYLGSGGVGSQPVLSKPCAAGVNVPFDDIPVQW